MKHLNKMYNLAMKSRVPMQSKPYGCLNYYLLWTIKHKGRVVINHRTGFIRQQKIELNDTRDQCTLVVIMEIYDRFSSESGLRSAKSKMAEP